MAKIYRDGRLAKDFGGLMATVLALGIVSVGCSCSTQEGGAAGDVSPDIEVETPTGPLQLRGEAWADNWFAMYLGDELVVEDAVPITTERSFNAETFTFEATDFPMVLSFVIKDFKEDDSGLEYIGTNRQQMGDGGFIFQLTDVDSGTVVAVSNADWKCLVVHQAPTNKACEQDANPSETCQSVIIEEPDGWKDADFDDSGWPNATEHSAQDVGPKDGYDTINWDDAAALIWTSDLESDNTLLCRTTVTLPDGLVINDPDPTPDPIEPDDRCAAITASIADAGFLGEVEVTCDDSHAYITSDTYPDHVLMTGILRTNLNIAVPALNHSIAIPLEPSLAQNITTIDNAVAVAVNGVPIYDYSSQGTIDPGTYDPRVDTFVNGELDICGGHAGRGDDYHYHVSPKCMIEAMPNKGDDAILGWGFDGYPLYGDKNPDGTDIADGDLNDCNGQPDEIFGHRYHTSAAPPYIVQCLNGEVDMGLHRPIPPISDAMGRDRSLGQLPQGGQPVDDFVMTLSEGGTRTLSFSQNGIDMSISYTPTGEAGCYNFITNTPGADPSTGVYCR